MKCMLRIYQVDIFSKTKYISNKRSNHHVEVLKL